jgi:hypothetical protein
MKAASKSLNVQKIICRKDKRQRCRADIPLPVQFEIAEISNNCYLLLVNCGRAGITDATA